MISGECKWTNACIGADVLTRLEEKSSIFEQYKEKYLFVFSKSGFSNSAKAYAAGNGIALFSLDMLYG